MNDCVKHMLSDHKDNKGAQVVLCACSVLVPLSCS